MVTSKREVADAEPHALYDVAGDAAEWKKWGPIRMDTGTRRSCS